MDDEVQAALLKLDEAIGATAEAVRECAQYVDAGKLDGNVVMLKMNELAAQLMAPPTAQAS